MAQQTTVRFIDDIDGSDAVGTVTFSLDNRAYEIDLSVQLSSWMLLEAAARTAGAAAAPPPTDSA